MNGTRISCTLWNVTYRYLNPDRAESSTPYLGGRKLISTADPTGADLLDVTRSVVLPKAEASDEFTITELAWIAEVRGLACLDSVGEA